MKGSSLVQTIFSLLSFVTSSSMAFAAAQKRLGSHGNQRCCFLTTPYRRIIFGVSIADVLRSIALLSGPWLISFHESTGDDIEDGSSASCQANGFLTIVGLIACPMYLCFLCLYYLCKLKLRMTDDTFHFKFERKIHIAIIAFSLLIASVAIGLDTIHPAAVEQFCSIALEATADSPVIDSRFIVIVSITVICCVSCFIGVVWIMGLLVLHGIRLSAMCQTGEERPVTARGPILLLPTTLRNAIARRPVPDSNANVNVNAHINFHLELGDRQLHDNEEEDFSLNGNNSFAFLEEEENEEEVEIPSPHAPPAITPSPHRQQLNHLSTTYRNETLIQAGCFIGVFCMMYFPILVSFFSTTTATTITSTNTTNVDPATASALIHQHPSPALVWMISIMYPLGGILNVLIYTRPKVLSLRRTNPEYSWVRALWLVLKTGGEVPTEQELRLYEFHRHSSCCRRTPGGSTTSSSSCCCYCFRSLAKTMFKRCSCLCRWCNCCCSKWMNGLGSSLSRMSSAIRMMVLVPPPSGREEVISDIQFGIASGCYVHREGAAGRGHCPGAGNHNNDDGGDQSSSLSSFVPNSMEGVDGRSASIDEDDLNYRSEAEWFYIKGGSMMMLEVVQEEEDDEDEDEDGTCRPLES